MLELAWLIPIFPLLAFALITLTPVRHNKAASGWLAIGLMTLATLLALGVAAEVAQGILVAENGSRTTRAALSSVPPEGVFSFPVPNIVRTFRWAPVGGMTMSGEQAPFTMGYLIDPMVAAMLVMVTITSTCIHMFSLGYMAHDERQARFFSFMSLFTAAMLTMVMASNLLLFFMAWEIMGLASYLLIGFWYDRNYPDPRQITPRQAAIKAFITTRIGDVLFMVGLAYLWTQAGSLDFGRAPGQIFELGLLQRLAATPTALGMSAATAIALLIFAGTIGKSAQFPLHVWLPDAMEGPTPVSALIHAATMVAAGVFLVARTYPIFEASGALPFVAFIGSLTALGAALIACAQFDIKRILAYSTISQLGFMVAALGIGGWIAALFHLLMHAFFKALLFLGAGSVIHGMEAAVGTDVTTSQDIRNMGDLRRFMPTTYWTYLVGALALAGIPPLAGFWSKDEILADALSNGHIIVWIVLSLASFLTAFYMTRQVRLVFFGQFRGDSPRRDTRPSEPKAVEHAYGTDSVAGAHEHGGHTPHESPWTMTVPLIILAIFAALAGFVNTPFAHGLSNFLEAEAGSFNIIAVLIATLVALAGVGAGWIMYRDSFATAQDDDPLERLQPAMFGALNRRLGFDELYARTIGVATTVLSIAWTALDLWVISRIVSGVGSVAAFLGRLNFIVDDTVFNDGADSLADGVEHGGDEVRRIETGRIQDYVGFVFGGVVVLGVVYLYIIQR
jgi:NADH-quinone oxidoreductase subunit L